MKNFLVFALAFLLCAPVGYVNAEVFTPSAADLDKAWDQLFAKVKYTEIVAEYEIVFKVEQSVDEPVDKQRCADNYSALSAGVKKLPMSLALSYWTYRCAEALGKEQQTEQYLQHFSAIAKYTLAQASDQRLAKPIRIMAHSDIVPLLSAADMSLRYQYIDVGNLGRYLYWSFVAWDEKDQRERTYRFDMLETIAKTSEPSLADFPAFRMALAKSLINEYAKDDWFAAQDAQVVIEASELPSLQAQLDKLKPMVLRGGYVASEQMFIRCALHKDQRCAEVLVDSMLDELEQKRVDVMVRMAALYSVGLGVKQDPDAAIALLNAAEKRSGDKGLALSYFMYLQFDKAQIQSMPIKLKNFLENESFLPNKGKAAAEFVSMQIRLRAEKETMLQYGPRLAALAKAGVEDVYALYAMYLVHVDNKTEYMRWIEAAARAGHPFVQRLYASDLYALKDKTKELEAFNWLLESARNGHLPSMMTVADGYFKAGLWANAVGWYESAGNLGNQDALFKLAEIYSMEPEGTDYTEKNAEELYQSMIDHYDSAKARREMARLLMHGDTVKHNLVKARQLLLKDAEQNDVDSMIMLGTALLHGSLGDVNEKDGLAWLEKAIAKDSPAAMDAMAMYFYSRKPDVANLARAKMLWEKAVEKKHPRSVNNYAWNLCTTSYDGYGDSKKGLMLFKLLDVNNLILGYRDSYAACLAANNDFEEALKQQQLVISGMKDLGLEKTQDMKNMLVRLELYRKKMPYVELPKGK
jgi:TPR repeat protein